ncbi:MAG: DcaP family trimeric outer membrane transporter [Pseudomonadota bacterium]|nr:DcaP family trimeric outer membrane transporter [Pseudomonadota bacterium]|tara:strand:+ start:45251 stop:46468 length:1218 start_codon:yes stop_codon:yes gene_type:complete
MKLLPLSAALVAAGMISTQVIADDVNQRIEKLEREISALKSQTASANSNVSSGSSSVSVGGYIKLDAQVSEYSDGRGPTGAGEDFLIVSTIPTGGDSSDPKTHFSAKESRLWIKGQTQTDAGLVKGHLEMDFQLSGQGNERVSNSYSPRVRHAYFSWNEWLFGQTWSTFFNVSALPDLLDFVGPVGTIFIRQPQIRYSSGPWQFAVENPESTLYAGGAATTFDDNAIPDMIARYNFGSGKANYSLSVMGRELAYDDGDDVESEYGYAVSLAGKIAVGDQGDDLRVMLNAGNALGRYMGLNAFRAGAIEADGDIELIDQWGVFVAYRHLWDKQWRSSFSLSAAQADNPDAAGGNAAEKYETFHANLIYKPTAALDLGGEIIIGQKEVESGDDGSINRLQFSAKYGF